MSRKFFIVYAKELREILRDPRALFLVALFVVLTPSAIGFGLHTMIKVTSKSERERDPIAVTVSGGAQAPTLMAMLKQHNVDVASSAALSDEAIAKLLHEGKTTAVLRLSDKFGQNYQAMRPARIELWFDSATDASSRRREVEAVLGEYGANIASARLLAHGVSPAALTPVELQRYDAGSAASRSARIIGTMLGMLFLPAFGLCMSASIDSTAGERERRSLEVLLAQPVSTLALVGGKWLAASTLAVLGVTLELLVAHAVLSWLPLEEGGMMWRLSMADILLVCLLTAPLSLFASALQIALAMNAKSFKEAQTILSFVMMLPMLPLLIVPMLELKTGAWMYLIPVLSNQTVLGELAKGQTLTAPAMLGTALSALLPALLAIGFASWRMKSERYVLTV